MFNKPKGIPFPPMEHQLVLPLPPVPGIKCKKCGDCHQSQYEDKTCARVSAALESVN